VNTFQGSDHGHVHFLELQRPPLNALEIGAIPCQFGRQRIALTELCQGYANSVLGLSDFPINTGISGPSHLEPPNADLLAGSRLL
jgi:hypothetical protein